MDSKSITEIWSVQNASNIGVDSIVKENFWLKVLKGAFKSRYIRSIPQLRPICVVFCTLWPWKNPKKNYLCPFYTFYKFPNKTFEQFRHAKYFWFCFLGHSFLSFFPSFSPLFFSFSSKVYDRNYLVQNAGNCHLLFCFDLSSVLMPKSKTCIWSRLGLAKKVFSDSASRRKKKIFFESLCW